MPTCTVYCKQGLFSVRIYLSFFAVLLLKTKSKNSKHLL